MGGDEEKSAAIELVHLFSKPKYKYKNTNRLYSR